jgi:RpiR family transcriptional regulator, carbohydrate utilization regulator
MKNPTMVRSRRSSRPADVVVPLPSRGSGARGLRPSTLDGVLGRLAALREGLSPTARRIAEFVLANASDVVDMSVTEVAERTQSSEGSVVGLCQQLGARGFQQLKIALARDLVQPVQFIHEDLGRDDSTATVLEKIFASNIQALQDTLKVLDAEQMARAVEAVLEARRVEVYGIGSAAPIAEDANYRLMRIGIETKVVVDSHVQAISAALAGPGVATITISHSGSTIETVTATRLAKKAGATTICITNYGKSPLLAHADIVLHTMAKETRFRTEAMTSRIAQLAIVDALIASLALATYDRSVETIAKTFDVLSTKRF